MLDPNSTITDGNVRFILSVLSNQAGYTALFNLLSENWNTLRTRYASNLYPTTNLFSNPHKFK